MLFPMYKISKVSLQAHGLLFGCSPQTEAHGLIIWWAYFWEIRYESRGLCAQPGGS